MRERRFEGFKTDKASDQELGAAEEYFWGEVYDNLFMVTHRNFDVKPGLNSIYMRILAEKAKRRGDKGEFRRISDTQELSKEEFDLNGEYERKDIVYTSRG